MLKITYTFLGDGSSDKCLLNIIRWILESLEISYVEQYADYCLPISRGLAERVKAALDLYPCDLLFVHRDAEKESYTARLQEIQRELNGIQVPTIPVIPVRMTEAWLLFDETAIRQAVGNLNGNELLNLPSLKQIETVPNPKETLFEAIKSASGLTGRRLAKLQPQQYRHRVAELISTYAPLRNTPSFVALENNINAFFNNK